MKKKRVTNNKGIYIKRSVYKEVESATLAKVERVIEDYGRKYRRNLICAEIIGELHEAFEVEE